MEKGRNKTSGIAKHDGVRVLHLHDRLSALGGADRHLLGVLEHCQGRVETFLGAGYDDQSLEAGERGRIGQWVRVKGLERSGLGARGGQAALKRLARVVEEFGPRVIHIHNVMDPALLRAAAGAAPCLMTVQDHRVFCPGLGKLWPGGAICEQILGPGCLECFKDADYGGRMLELTQARLAALADMKKVLVLSRYMARELVAAGLDPAQVEVLPPFVHGLAGAPLTEPGGYHLLACRLVERKGVRVALRAACMLEPGARLKVAGDGPLADEVAQVAEASGGMIEFVGWAGRAEMADLLRGALSLWLPSLWAEPFGIAGLEALALARPVVASDVGGVSDWLEHGVSGLLVAPGDDKALAGAAQRLADEPDLARSMGAAGAAMAAERFAAPVLMERIFEIYGALALGDTT